VIVSVTVGLSLRVCETATNRSQSKDTSPVLSTPVIIKLRPYTAMIATSDTESVTVFINPPAVATTAARRRLLKANGATERETARCTPSSLPTVYDSRQSLLLLLPNPPCQTATVGMG